MRSGVVLALVVSMLVAFSVSLTDAAKVNSVETVYMAYNDPGTRLQFLNQLQTMWMNELNQFQLVDVPKVEFISEVKNVGTMPGDLGGQPANKVTYRLTGSTALPFDLATERRAFQDSTMAGHMGPISFGLDGDGSVTNDDAAPALLAPVAKPLGFNKEYFIYLKYSGNSDRTRFLNQILTIWKSVFSAQTIQASNLKITFSREESTTQNGIKKVFYKISGSGTWNSQSSMTSSLATIKDSVYQKIDQQQLANIFTTLDVPTAKLFSYTATIYLQFVKVFEQTQLLTQVTDIWKSVLAAQNNPSDDLAITIINDEQTGQTNLHKITYRVTGTADYETMGYFDMIKTTVYSTINKQNLKNIFTTLPTAPVVAPIAVPKTWSKTFSYNSVVYLRYAQQWQTNKLLSQLVQVWKDILRSQNNPADDLTATITDDQQTQNGLHKITYRITGMAVYDNMQYFDSIRDLVFQLLDQQPIDGIYSSETRGSTTSTDSAKLFSYTATIYLQFVKVFEQTQLLGQVTDIWKSVLAAQNNPSDDLAITIMNDEPTGQTNLHKITYRVTGTADYETMGYFDMIKTTVYSTINQQNLKNIFTTLPMAPVVAPIPVPNTRSKPFSYTSVVYLRYAQQWQTGPLLSQLVQVWKDVLRSQNNPADAVTATITDDQQTTQNGLHKITYRITGTAVYDNMQYFDSIRDLVFQFLDQQPIDSIYSSLTRGSTTGKPFIYDSSMYLEFNQPTERTRLLNLIIAAWKSVLAGRSTPSDDLTITMTNDQTTIVSGVHKISFRVTGTTVYDDVGYFDTIDSAVLQYFVENPARGIYTDLIVPTTDQVNQARTFSYDSNIYLLYSQTEDRTRLLNLVTAAWKSVLAGKNNPSNDLTITLTNDETTTVPGVHKITFRVTGTVVYDSMVLFDLVNSGVYQSFVQNPTEGIYTDLFAAAADQTRVQSGSGPKPFLTTGSLNLKYSGGWARTQLLYQILAVWRNVLSSMNMDVPDLTILFTREEPTNQNGVMKVYFEVSGTVPYDRVSVFEDVRNQVYNTLAQQPINNVWLASGTVLAPTPALSGHRLFSYEATIYLKFGQQWELNKLLEQLTSAWQTTLMGKNNRVDDLAITIVRDESTTQNGIHKITYRVTGTADYVDMSYFDVIKNAVYATFDAQQVDNIFITLPSPSSPWSSTNSDKNGFQYSMALLMTYDNSDASSRDKLLGQVLSIWQKVLSGYNIMPQDVSMNFNEEKPTQYGVNKYLVTFTIIAPSVAAVSRDAVYNAFVSRLQASPIFGVEIAPLGNGWTSGGKVDWSAEGKSDSDQTDDVTQAPAVPAWMKQPQPAWKPAPVPSWVKPTPQPAWVKPKPTPQPAWKPAPAWQPATPAPVQVTTTTTTPRPIQTWIQGPVNGNTIADKMKVDKTFIPTYQVAPTNIYMISDQFRLTANSDEERSRYMDQLDSAWQTAIGNTTEFVQLVLYRDDVLPGQNSNTHDLGYVVVIVSSNANLDITPFKATFDRIRPRAPVGLLTFASDLVPSSYAFLVLRDTIPRAYTSNADRDDFLGKLQQLYVQALGKDALTVALAVYDDDVLDRMLDVTSGSTVKDLHQLSYFVLIVSDKIMDSDDVQHRFQQYLISRSVSCVV